MNLESISAHPAANSVAKPKTPKTHWFVDESGDTTFTQRGESALGRNGVSYTFALGAVKFRTDPAKARTEIQALAERVSKDPTLSTLPSVQKCIRKSGSFYFHAKNDEKRVRELMFALIRTLNVRFVMRFRRKSVEKFLGKHAGCEKKYYEFLLSQLIKQEFSGGTDHVVLNVAARGNTTSNKVISGAIESARTSLKNQARKPMSVIEVQIKQTAADPLLSVVDYLMWAVFRVIERGDLTHYELIKDRFSICVCDHDDTASYNTYANFYHHPKYLTSGNKISPQSI